LGKITLGTRQTLLSQNDNANEPTEAGNHQSTEEGNHELTEASNHKPTDQVNNILYVEPTNYKPTEYAYNITSITSNLFKVEDHQLKDILTVPTNFEDAYYHSKSWCRNKCREAIQLELQKIETLKV
jgi:hypothetical protein